MQRYEAVLLDIEGTTSSISFVYDVMFPFARRELDRYLVAAANTNELKETADLLAKDVGFGSLREWLGTEEPREALPAISREVIRLMDADVKATGLKQLQGLIWRDGFERGELRSHVFEDVPECLRRWHELHIDVRIYSSGSIAAQRLFFKHTTAGDLTTYLHGHYDTTTGPKHSTESYRRIADEYSCDVSRIVFVSDVVAELSAARQAGLGTYLAIRPGNRPVEDAEGHLTTCDFQELPVGPGRIGKL